MGRVSPFVLPRNLVDSVRQDHSPERRIWVEQLPAVIDELARRWSLHLGPPYQPGGQCSWVAPVRDSARRERVLKVGWRHDEAHDEAAGLRTWDGCGAVYVHDSDAWDSTSALLLERARPGTTLDLAASETDQDLIVTDLLQQLWTAPIGNHPFRTLQMMCAKWAVKLEQRLAAGPGALDPGLARAGLELLAELPATAERTVLLCTDLHAGNIVAAQRRRWLAIDPKPYLGDPTYDVVQHLLNCPERLTADPAGLVHKMAFLAGLDPARVAHWLFARCVLEATDQPHLRDIAIALAPR